MRILPGRDQMMAPVAVVEGGEEVAPRPVPQSP